jgi:hypothetical protein
MRGRESSRCSLSEEVGENELQQSALFRAWTCDMAVQVPWRKRASVEPRAPLNSGNHRVLRVLCREPSFLALSSYAAMVLDN